MKLTIPRLPAPPRCGSPKGPAASLSSLGGRRHAKRTGAACWALLVIVVSAPATGASKETSTEAGETALSTEAQAGEQPSSQPPPSRLLSLLDKTHAGISRSLSTAVHRADRFFATENVFEETNASYARLPMDLIMERNKGATFKARLKGKIRLPHVQQRLRLLIESDISDPLDEEQPATSPPDAIAENDYFLSLETQLKKTGRWKIRPATGIEFSLPPDLFVRLRAIRYFALTRKWLGRFSSTGIYLVDAGVEGDGNLQFSRALSKHLLFRSRSQIKWTEEKGYSDASQTFSIYQHLSEKANLAYNAGSFGNDQRQGWDVTEHRIWIRYRRLVYGEWLFMDLIPEVRFQQGDDYEPTYFLTFRIEPVFGERLPVSKLRSAE